MPLNNPAAYLGGPLNDSNLRRHLMEQGRVGLPPNMLDFAGQRQSVGLPPIRELTAEQAAAIRERDEAKRAAIASGEAPSELFGAPGNARRLLQNAITVQERRGSDPDQTVFLGSDIANAGGAGTAGPVANFKGNTLLRSLQRQNASRMDRARREQIEAETEDTRFRTSPEAISLAALESERNRLANELNALLQTNPNDPRVAQIRTQLDDVSRRVLEKSGAIEPPPRQEPTGTKGEPTLTAPFGRQRFEVGVESPLMAGLTQSSIGGTPAEGGQMQSENMNRLLREITQPTPTQVPEPVAVVPPPAEMQRLLGEPIQPREMSDDEKMLIQALLRLQ